MLLSLVMAGILLFVVAAAKAEEAPIYPIGEVTIEAKQLAAGLGYSWGDGVMKFQGKEYRFAVQGLNVAAVGFAKIHAVGDVYNLKTAADLAGKYVAVSAGLSLAKGAAGLSMRNNKGVVINLRSAQQGVQLNLGVDGFDIKMK
jgi:ABC-type amino acid transport substrate-binding protein